MIFFLDENLSEHAARMLEHFDRKNEIRALVHSFARGTPDVEWMNAVAKWEPKPVLVCGDARILRNQAEKCVLRECGLMCVFLPRWTMLDWNEFAWKIIKAWPAVVHNVQHAREPTIFQVTVKSLKVERLGLVRDL